MQDVKVGTTQYIRDLNMTAIFRLIHKYGPVSRKDLAENTGYSAATISNHVKRLLESNFVIETNKGSSTGGRKPVYLTVNSERGYILAIDIEVSNIHLFLFDLSLEIKDQLLIPIDGISAEEQLHFILEKSRCFFQKTEINLDKVIGMGIALPGLVDNKKGYLHFAPNLKWENIDIRGYFQEVYDFTVLVENEAKAAVIGERELIYPDIDNMVFVSINEGIGCGIVLNGSLYRGASGNAGEFGHIIIDSDGPECHCGNYGCWETLASINYIISEYYRKTGEVLKSSQLLDRDYIKDNKKLTLIIRECARNIAIGIVNIINSLSPEMLVIGGDIIAIKEYIAEEIESIISKRALSISYDKSSLVFSKLGNKASIYGIARMVFENSIEGEITRKII